MYFKFKEMKRNQADYGNFFGGSVYYARFLFPSVFFCLFRSQGRLLPPVKRSLFSVQSILRSRTSQASWQGDRQYGPMKLQSVRHGQIIIRNSLRRVPIARFLQPDPAWKQSPTDKYDQYSSTVGLNQRIFDFGKTPTQVRINSLNTESSRFDLDNTLNTVVFNCETGIL